MKGHAPPLAVLHAHLHDLRVAIASLESQLGLIRYWGSHLARLLVGGRRLLIAGNGGSAAHAQHLSAELLGRYRHERAPLSAIALHSDASSIVAIADDYGVSEIFARQVRAHGRRGDVLLLLSASGRSPNILAAAAAGRVRGLSVWALTGARPNSLAELADSSIAIDAEHATVQEVHQVVIHLLCEAIDELVVPSPPSRRDELLRRNLAASPQNAAGGPSSAGMAANDLRIDTVVPER